ncbi:origin recognition complex subunit 3 N-terminus-domain-containing protein [Lipomyces japonicus]|uniref:origin recognition complex subunit 3 N-terminus-domain-containing protein n=1 Tax=Lipomyces japonicus TaxID=56871 RepID=UPI0034CDB4B7
MTIPTKRKQDEIVDLINDRDAHKTYYIIEPKLSRKSQARNVPFVALHQSVTETSTQVHERWTTFVKHMTGLQSRIDSVLDAGDSATLVKVFDFVVNCKKFSPDEDELPVGFIMAGANIANHARMFSNLEKHILNHHEQKEIVTVRIGARDATNIKLLISRITDQVLSRQKTIIEDVDGEDDQADSSKMANDNATNDEDRRQPYDLDVLTDWCLAHDQVIKIAVIVQDADGFEPDMLSELIRNLHLYRNRIPFVLLLGIATTLPIFNAKLPKAAVRRIEFSTFDVLHNNELLTNLINNVILADESIVLPGPNLFKTALTRYVKLTRNFSSFTDALKYAYMTHFFANPLSAHVEVSASKILKSQHVSALRLLPSFKSYVESLLTTSNPDKDYIKGLFESSKEVVQLLASSKEKVNLFKIAKVELLQALQILQIVAGRPGGFKSAAELYADAISGTLAESNFLRTLFLSLDDISQSSIESLNHVIDASSNRALNEFKIAWTSDRSFSGRANHKKLVQFIHQSFFDYISSRAQTSFEDIPFNELFFIDIPTLVDVAFKPRVRGAIEHSLRTPEHYLGEEGKHEGMSIAYRLLREAGAVINLYDFYQAFKEAIEATGTYGDETTVTALFYSVVNQLRYIGMVKESSSKRTGTSGKVEVSVLQKLIWEGL